MTPQTVLLMAELQGHPVTPARAGEIAAVVEMSLAAVTKISASIPFEAEPEHFGATQEALAR